MSDEPENQPTEPERPAELPPPVAPTQDRGRPRRGTSLGWLVASLAAIGLPGAVAGYLGLREARGLQEVAVRLAAELNRFSANWEEWQKGQRDQLGQFAEKCTAVQERLHLLERETAFTQFSNRMTRLLSGKTAEQILADPAVGKALEQLSPPLEAALLLDAEGMPVRIPPRLAAKEAEAWRAEIKNAPEGVWKIFQPPESPLRVAMRVTAAAPLALAPTADKVAEIPSAEELETAAGRLAQWARILLVGVTTAGLALAFLFFFALRQRLWRPLRQAVDTARRLLESPSAEVLPPARIGGPAAELDLSWERLRERLSRLENLENERGQRSQELTRMEEAVRRVAAGDLSVRLPLASGELQLLALGMNRLLDTLSGSLEALSRTCARCAVVAEGLQQTARSLSQRISEPEKLADNSAVAQTLSLSLESLHRSAMEIASGENSTAPAEELPAVDLDSLVERVSTIEELARLLNGEGERAAELAQQAMLLHTQLGLLRTSNSSLEEPKQRAHFLAQELDAMRTAWRERTQQLAQAARWSGEQAGQAAAALRAVLGLAREAVSRRRQLSEGQRLLLKQLETILPLSRTLGEVFGRLTREAELRGALLNELRQAVLRVSELAEQLGELASSVHQEVRRLSPAASAPAVFSQELARSRQSLERAMRAMEEAAVREGIRMLAPETAEIMERIRDIAEDARSRLLQAQAGSAEGSGNPG